jgi:hypothetical protein
VKNKITDLRDHMFAQLERLSNEELTPEELQTEIERAKAISEVGKVIVESAKTEVLHLKLTGRLHERKPKFLNEDITEDAQVVPIVRPKAEYTNQTRDKLLDKYDDSRTGT